MSLAGAATFPPGLVGDGDVGKAAERLFLSDVLFLLPLVAAVGLKRKAMWLASHTLFSMKIKPQLSRYSCV